MKKVITICIIWVAFLLLINTILIFIYSFDFTLSEQDIYTDATKLISALNKEPFSKTNVCDSVYENSSESFILKVTFSDSPDKYYAFSYLKHPILPFYKRTFYADYSIEDFGGILLADGFPYATAYDISSFRFVFKDKTLSSLVITLISCTAVSTVLFSVFCFLKYTKYK